MLTCLCLTPPPRLTRPQMIVEPELRVADFAKAGADIISVHAEQSSTIHLHRTLNMVSAPAASPPSRLVGMLTLPRLSD